MKRIGKSSPNLNNIIAGMAISVFISSPALAADFPETGRAITVNVPLGTGGRVDLMARAMAPYWDAKWGTRTLVLNEPVANGQIALTEMLKQKSDGQTSAFTQGFDTQMSHLHAEAEAPYSRSSFIPVGMIQSTPSVWVVKADGPYRTMGALPEAAAQAWSAMLEAISPDPALRERMDEMAIQLSYTTPGDPARAWTATEAEVRQILMRASGEARPVQ